MGMIVTFPGGAAVEAGYKGFSIRTDQPPENGGKASAPSPFDLFIASLGTCAGFYALRFCQQRQLSTAGMQLSLDIDRNPENKRLNRVSITLVLPVDFPEKYRPAIVRAIDQCAVKQALLDPPEVSVTTTSAPI